MQAEVIVERVNLHHSNGASCSGSKLLECHQRHGQHAALAASAEGEVRWFRVESRHKAENGNFN